MAIKFPWEDAISAVITEGGKLIDDAIHTDQEKAADKALLLKMQFTQMMQANAAQIEAYVADAKSGRRGWRYKAAMVCVTGIGYSVIIQPLLTWLTSLVGVFYGVKPDVIITMLPPTIDVSLLVSMLVGMLGLAGTKAYDLKFGSRT